MLPEHALYDLRSHQPGAGEAGLAFAGYARRFLFDAAPPAVYDSFLTYADPTYDFVGRYVYGRLAHKF